MYIFDFVKSAFMVPPIHVLPKPAPLQAMVSATEATCFKGAAFTLPY